MQVPTHFSVQMKEGEEGPMAIPAPRLETAGMEAKGLLTALRCMTVAGTLPDSCQVQSKARVAS